MSPRAEQIALALNEQRSAFKAFLSVRVGSEAEDILQNSLLKVLAHADDITDPGQTTAWFYRVLRNATIDHYRAKGSARHRDQQLGELVASLGEDIVSAPEWAAEICRCLDSVVDTLPTRSAEILRRVDLKDESVQDAAQAMKLSPNNASVILHRARKELRAKLVTFCGACADGACLDCNCEKTDASL